MQNSEIGGIRSPRRTALAIRSQRARTRAVVGRKLRSKLPVLRSTVPRIASSGTVSRPDVLLADVAQRLDDLVVGEDHVDVARLAPDAPRERRQHLAPADPLEVVLCVGGREAGVERRTHGCHGSPRPQRIH